MHVHLPKPLHGWREFAGEVGIIVIGVLIALGAEQVIETIHWRHKASKADASLRDELEASYAFAAEVVIAEPCIDRQLQVLEARLAQAGSDGPAPMYSDASGEFVIRAPSRPWSDDVWRSVVTEGVASQFSEQFRQGLASHYGQVLVLADNTRSTDLLGWRLRVLAQPRNLDANGRSRLAEEIEEARGRFQFDKLVGNQIIGRLIEMKRVPLPEELRQYLAHSGTITFCRTHGLPLGNVEQQKPRR